MDDIRRTYDGQRADYRLPRPGRSIPVQTEGGSLPPTEPVSHQVSVYNDTFQPQPAPAHLPHHPPPQPVTPHQPHHAVHHQANSFHHTPRKKHRFHPVMIPLAILVVTGLVAAGYFLKSTTAPDNTIPPQITQQAHFNVYFPSPMPTGYTYMKSTATFQIGQVFYKFANGAKRVTVNEQPMPATKPNFNLLAGYSQFNSSVGKAAIGSTFGQPTAVILAGKTVITMNTSGKVTPDELKAAINNLKNIGQNPRHS